MKKAFVVGLVLFAAVFAQANVAQVKVVGKNPPTGCMSDWTPLKLSLAGPVALPPGYWDLKGLDIGVWCWSENVDGCQIGIVNAADVMRGCQIGVVNVTRQAYGVQIGLVNVIESKDIPFLPILNWYF